MSRVTAIPTIRKKNHAHDHAVGDPVADAAGGDVRNHVIPDHATKNRPATRNPTFLHPHSMTTTKTTKRSKSSGVDVAEDVDAADAEPRTEIPAMIAGTHVPIQSTMMMTTTMTTKR